MWLCARCEDVGARNGRKLARLAESKKVIHLAHGCKVLLVRNVAYVYGLANGIRGTLVGVVYGQGGIGTFPEALVLDVPDYVGPAFYPDEPTWVLILPF